MSWKVYDISKSTTKESTYLEKLENYILKHIPILTVGTLIIAIFILISILNIK